MDSAAVPNGRGIVEIAGEDARALLQRLITNDVDTLTPGEARYAALLSPQGKIVVDFLVVSAPAPEQPERFLLDCPAGLATDLARKLNMYKLRAKVTVADRSAELGAIALVGPTIGAQSELLVYSDPRSPALGQRAIGPHASLAILLVDDDRIRTRRIAAGVPEGGVDFGFNDAFPHEANLDRLHGVDFRKGCYVGQEVVSRMQHRGTARKRVAQVTFEGPAPAPGTELKAGELPIGTMGAAAGHAGLAMVRTDRVAEAVAAGTPIMAGDATLAVEVQETV